MKKFTIITLAVALTAVFAVTAMANEWNLYGSARMATFYTVTNYGDDFFGTNQDDDAFGRSNVKNTEWNLQGNSRIGATVKGDMLEARFEYGASGGNANIRRIYGVWKFAEGWGLKVGQDYTPITFFLSGQVFDADAGLLQVGNAYGSRKGQIAIEGMGFKVAAITQNTGAVVFQATDPATGQLVTLQSTSESYFPKLEASYQFKFGDGMSAHAFGGWQNIKFYLNNPITGADANETINSWVFGLGADLNFGPMFVKPQASYYRNGAAAGWLGLGTANVTRNINQNQDFDDLNSPRVINGAVGNVDSLMAMLALGFSPTEQLTLEAGVGYLYTDVDNRPGGPKDNSYLELYLQAVYQMAPGVFIVPEVGWRDFGDLSFNNNADGTANADEDLGDALYFGAKWQINF